jgi:anthranilate phosphoribosyltransferase
MERAQQDLEVPAFDLTKLIGRAASGQRLSADEAEAAFIEVMEGRATPVQLSALLVALRVRGETPQEIAGGVRALRRAMIPVTAPDDWILVDTCGTGGGAVTTFNISTAAAFVAAGAGVHIAKHGNRSFTSRCGSADVLTALGVRIELTPEQMSNVLQRAGIVFMFAPLLHPAMKHVAPVRRELAMPTIMNVLGPLTNPASARRQVVGVSHPALMELIAGALQELGHERALVVHGEPGLDEFSPIGITTVYELLRGELIKYDVDPQTFGGSYHDPFEMRGLEPEQNAQLLLDVLENRAPGVARLAVTLNAGAAIYLGDRAQSLREGWQLAEASLADGSAMKALERLRSASLAV